MGRYAFLLESDHLSLSSSFDVAPDGAELYDPALGARHAFSAPGSVLLRTLATGASLRRLQRLCTHTTVETSQLNEVLGFLNAIGALRVKRRSIRRSLEAAITACQHALYGARYAAHTWRRPATASHLARGVLRVCWPVNAAGCLAGLLLAGSGMAAPEVAAAFTAFGALLFASSIYVHELGHLWVIHQTGASAVLLQHGLRLGIVHLELAPRQEIMSALAGPLSGMAWCIIWASVTMVSGAPELALFGYGIASFHIASFLPGYGDGQSLSHAIQKLSKRTPHEI